jgi:hypothetical protein
MHSQPLALEKEQSMPTPLNLVKGIGPATAEKLAAAGLNTAEDVAAATPEQLAVVPGFAESRSKQVIAHARQLVAAAAPDPVQTSHATPAAGQKGEATSKKAKPSKKSKSKKKAGKKKAKTGKLKKDKNKADKGKKEKDNQKKGKKSGAEKKIKKKKAKKKKR